VTSTEVTADLKYKDHPQWDSMAVLSVIAMVDEYYSKVLTGEEIETLETVSDLYQHVSK
jgi:acyl carrier protein